MFEAREGIHRIEFGPRDVVKPEAALLDDVEDLLDAHLAGIVDFQRTARDEPAVEDREDGG